MDRDILKVGQLRLTDSCVEDAEKIADNMRFTDVRECYIWGVTPLEALTEPLVTEYAETYTIKHQNKPIAMLGVTPVEGLVSTARVWMLGTIDITYNFRPFLRGCKTVIEMLQGNYDEIENFVPIDHEETVMWLSWCGFEFDEDVYLMNGHQMLRFVRCVNYKNNVYTFKRPVKH
tara:strand:- start:1995 stop:2519 length:525 start_codon:yes stop_codon:yes gene_type:complete